MPDSDQTYQNISEVFVEEEVEDFVEGEVLILTSDDDLQVRSQQHPTFNPAPFPVMPELIPESIPESIPELILNLNPPTFADLENDTEVNSQQFSYNILTDSLGPPIHIFRMEF